ncbi:hypothetical protein SAMN05192566_1556 [Methylophilus rhizosphaerae]|uniref:Uncharacterized protein n=1 Tax=Methylophilus rhizosphaerae TaxID=492660 RepID=A0A1G9CNY4_9PROT|nr:hypothetical protein SAMN05192566_1556 [Methylophilus rhizosphaerae]
MLTLWLTAFRMIFVGQLLITSSADILREEVILQVC